MKLYGLGAGILLACAVTSRAAPIDEPVTTDTTPASDIDAASQQIEALLAQSKEVTESSLSDASTKRRREDYDGQQKCSLKNLLIRTEWSALSSKEKKSYISAVRCLQSKPARTPSTVAPGAKTRYDDFVATHIDQTLTIHYTGNFLTWHRFYTWVYERALREECGYTGTQPYWDWSRSAKSGLTAHPLFDGSATSMSGNGAHIDQTNGSIVLSGAGLPSLYLPVGNGGGCVSGPFKDYKVNLGPASLALSDGSTLAVENPKAYNPRCLKRDLTDAINQRYANASSVVNLILRNDDIASFQLKMQGVPGTGEIGVHGGGHYSLGGDPGRDVFVSPGDPAFFFHHAMIDRTYWMWQLLSPKTRTHAIAGTNTFFNMPPSADTTLDDIIDLGYVTDDQPTIESLGSTIEGPFCYIYI
ncbi:Di-copper centre-containing protein [Pseudovirgaria hyperparasitica]|uniref:Di-copper centre-containing protein n=1 Tax=Pseudovirgaria hyperparasitica TaxID=470096 RepID=A0A6A6VYK2_9PEZI|nr:Di-copper centre-containing protein [Pseudovirgaria hyperparasitica]KAF2755738.1 Di-copper centre-containing protein [Pseudovirgaria hyperparasitica]